MSISKEYGRKLKKKQLVGIINCTPDSYFEKGRFMDPQEAIDYGLRLIDEGADILDIGGESTRPQASGVVDAAEELRRVLPVIKGLRAKSDIPLSIDTFRPTVAAAAIDAGANWINDITGFGSPEMRRLAASTKATCCIMHMYGSPHTHPKPIYPKGVLAAVTSFFKERISLLINEGIDPAHIVLDPGIGGGSFGKNEEHCLQLLKHAHTLTTLGFPLLFGLSRKSFQQKILEKPASEVLSTTLALNTIALLEGVTYLRIHDVKEHRDILKVLTRLEAVE